MGKAKQKPLELPIDSFRKTVNPHPCRDLCHHQGLERHKSGNFHHIPIQVSYLVYEDDGSLRVTVDYYRPNQVVIPTVRAFQTWFHYLSKSTHLLMPGMHY